MLSATSLKAEWPPPRQFRQRARQTMNIPLIQTIGLKKYFRTSAGLLHAVDGVNLTVEKARPWG